MFILLCTLQSINILRLVYIDYIHIKTVALSFAIVSNSFYKKMSCALLNVTLGKFQI